MVMVLTVIPVEGTKSYGTQLTQAFDIEGPFVSPEDAIGRLNDEGGLDDILKFIAGCQRRLSDLIGESVILVNFEEQREGESGTPFSGSFNVSLN